MNIKITNNKFIKTSKQFLENKLVEYPRIKTNSEYDVPRISSREKNVNNNHSSQFTEIKEWIYSKRIPLSKTTVEELEKLDFVDFLVTSQKVISERVGIPKRFYAIIFPDKMPKRTLMSYDFLANRIAVNIDSLDKCSNSSLFNYLRHEIEHQRQLLDLLRTEGLGNDTVKLFAKLQTNAKITTGETLNSQEIQEINLKYLKKYEQFKQRIVEQMGVIPANSKQARFSRKYLADIINSGTDNININTFLEGEAYLAGYVGGFEYFAAKWKSKFINVLNSLFLHKRS